MNKKILLGDEALAQGALDAGLTGVYAYPGTPSTEITEYIQMAQRPDVHCTWSSNEKTAMEEALGMSYAGKRAMVCMKHVGMNVCADAFVNSAITGANGGLVVVAADDPSMHSSQNEQDSRFYANFAFMPCMEPSNQQEAYNMARYAFHLSEEFGVPVLMRLTTRMAHSRAVVETQPAEEQNALHTPQGDKQRQWVTLPANSKVRYPQLLKDYAALEEVACTSPFNSLTDANDHHLGIITTGIGYNYLMENYPEGCPFPVLKITQYPMPKRLMNELADMVDELLVIEEGQPLVEQALLGVLPQVKPIHGRLDGTLPRTGELTPDAVRQAVGLPELPKYPKSEVVAPRPPALCQGCGHRDMYTVLTRTMSTFPEGRVFADIGCYTLGWLAPFHALHTCVEMGASITMAQGAAYAGVFPAVAVIGDSTFTHSGMTGLLDAVNMKSNIVVIISDNLTTGMTGGQDSAGTGRLEKICYGLGVEPEHVRVVVPLPKNYDEMETILREEIAYKGVSVIIPRRECIQTLKRHAKAKK